MTVGGLPIGKAVFANGSHDVGDQIQIIIQRDDRAFVGQRGNAVGAGPDQVGQAVHAAGQGGRDLGVPVGVRTPVHLQVNVGVLFDGGQIVAAVEFGGILVEVDAQRRNGQGLIQMERLGRSDLNVLPPAVFHSADGVRQGGGHGQQHGESQYERYEFLHA